MSGERDSYNETQRVKSDAVAQQPLKTVALPLPVPQDTLFPAQRDAGDGRDLARPVQQGLIAYAKQYGLDAWAGDVCLMYGLPYITERGAIRIAKRSKGYKGFSCSPCSPDTRTELELGDRDSAWVCEVWVEGYQQPVVEYGVVTRHEVQKVEEIVRRRLTSDPKNREVPPERLEALVVERLSYLPLWRYPSGQARVRAIRRAHLSAFPPERAATESAPVEVPHVAE